MREIKFRAWDGEKMWYQGNEDTCLVFFGQKDRIPFGVYNDAESRRLMTGDKNAIFNEPAILMQYTGLNDKNGNPIYEGDIIESVFTKENVVVEWDNKFAQFTFGGAEFNVEANPLEIVVLGNIYEHPHLLENKIEK